jgi:hypothetical protein
MQKNMLGRAADVGAGAQEAAPSSNRSGAADGVTAGAAQSSSVAAAAAAAAANGAASLALPDVLAADWTVAVPTAAGADENTSYDFSLKVLSVMSVIRAEERGAWRRREQKLLREIAELKLRLGALNPAGALHAALEPVRRHQARRRRTAARAHDAAAVGGLGSRAAERMRAETAASVFDLKLGTLMDAAVAAHLCSMPRRSRRRKRPLRWRRRGGGRKKRRKASKTGSAYENGVLRVGRRYRLADARRRAGLARAREVELMLAGRVLEDGGEVLTVFASIAAVTVPPRVGRGNRSPAVGHRSRQAQVPCACAVAARTVVTVPPAADSGRRHILAILSRTKHLHLNVALNRGFISGHTASNGLQGLALEWHVNLAQSTAGRLA